jgi:hypothetical protein
MHNQSRQNGPAIEAHFRFLLWIGPTVENFPRSQKFILGDRIQAAALEVQEALIEATYTRPFRVPSCQDGDSLIFTTLDFTFP